MRDTMGWSKTIPNSDSKQALSKESSINEVLQAGDTIRRLQVVNLGDAFPSAKVANSLKFPGEMAMGPDSWSTQTLMRHNRRDDRGRNYVQLLRSGPRKTLHFDPANSSAVIVTCGGLCPGLNSVIREIVMTLTAYGVKNVFGCVGGYKGMVKPETWMKLTPPVVQDIHKKGGTILVSDRGNPPHMDIAKMLQEKNIKQYFVIGGDGTQAGAFETFRCTKEIQHEVAVVGVPKTIDNDIPVLDRSFGFNTACSEAERAISSAYVEATCNSHCIGLVKLMGRHCGFIALHATLAARSVDLCLLPEMDISLPRVLSYCMHLMKTKGHAVIVVAEGCGDTLLKSSGERDAGGNKKLADVGPWLRDQILSYAKRMQQPLTIKYIDPTYTIRAVPANTNDSVYCSVLGAHAVHVAMAGYTGIVVGKVDERYVMLPNHAITKAPARRVELKSSSFERLMATTGQPNLAPGPGDDWALLPAAPPQRPQKPAPALPEMMSFVDWNGLKVEEESIGGNLEIKDVALKTFDGFGEVKEERPLQCRDIMTSNGQIRKLEVMRLSDNYPSAEVSTPLTPSAGLLDNNAWAVEAVSTTDRVDSGAGRPCYQLLRAGPRGVLHFNPEDAMSCSAIVICGGLCPGENVAIHQRRNSAAMARFLGMLLLVSRVCAMKCPGSASFIHASAKVVAIADASCHDVHEEVLGRVKSPTWHDPHNGGTYTILSESSAEIDLKRLTGNKKYTDHLAGAPCGRMIMGCSESQVFSIADGSTNYCNLRNLYCGSTEGKKDFTSKETEVNPSLGAGSDATACIKGPQLSQ
eukprot:s3997_g1.t3